MERKASVRVTTLVSKQDLAGTLDASGIGPLAALGALAVDSSSGALFIAHGRQLRRLAADGKLSTVAEFGDAVLGIAVSAVSSADEDRKQFLCVSTASALLHVAIRCGKRSLAL
jgi:hypothetical protein